MVVVVMEEEKKRESMMMMISEMPNSALFDDDVIPYSYDLSFSSDYSTTFEDLMNVITTPALSRPLPSPAPEYSSSISSSSTEPTTGNYDLLKKTEQSVDDDDENQEKTEKLSTTTTTLKPKKKKQKKERGARFAFMTKSDVDHLDDGFRWRKYGQKAVKNSPFPRSYYRCTSTGCGVKKRVERCCDEASIVVTTYEGTHTHPCPVILLPRGPTTFITSSINMPFHHNNNNFSIPFVQERPFRPSARDHGLLQDMLLLPSKEEEE